jgi:hypothetical protein
MAVEQTMPKLWLILLHLVFIPLMPLQAAEDEGFEAVDLDRWIEDSTPVVKGLPVINPRKIVFRARLAAAPKPGKSEYLLRTLQGLGVDPLPSVHHQFSVTSPGGKRLRMYVEDGVASRMIDLKSDSWLTLYGYHIYASAQGPAILLSDFERLSVWGGWLESAKVWYRGAAQAFREKTGSKKTAPPAEARPANGTDSPAASPSAS